MPELPPRGRRDFGGVSELWRRRGESSNGLCFGSIFSLLLNGSEDECQMMGRFDALTFRLGTRML